MQFDEQQPVSVTRLTPQRCSHAAKNHQQILNLPSVISLKSPSLKASIISGDNSPVSKQKPKSTFRLFFNSTHFTPDHVHDLQ